jgi:hypothetical protein
MDMDIMPSSERRAYEDTVMIVTHYGPTFCNLELFLQNVYFKDVFPRAYMLVDPRMMDRIIPVIEKDIFALHSICLLSSTFLLQKRCFQDIALEFRKQKMDFFSDYNHSLGSDGRQITQGQALGSLQLISNSLFAAGAPPWKMHLKVAFTYVHPLIRDTPVHGLDPSTLFIAQITGWFCVLAAISNDLRFRSDYLKTFIPLFEVGNYVGDNAHRYMNMSEIMGADCRVLWALAEITDLAQNKSYLAEDEIRRRGEKITNRLSECRIDKLEYHDANIASIHTQRSYTGELFRLSALLYYYSIIHDNNPYHEDVSTCPDKMIDLILVSGASSITSRMCVFGIFLCGALCKSGQIPYLRHFLAAACDENVGNSRAVLEVLEEIWWERGQNPASANVNWRDPLKRKKLLLV